MTILEEFLQTEESELAVRHTRFGWGVNGRTADSPNSQAILMHTGMSDVMCSDYRSHADEIGAEFAITAVRLTVPDARVSGQRQTTGIGWQGLAEIYHEDLWWLSALGSPINILLMLH